MQQSLISIRMDENLKKHFDFVCNELGLSISGAITIFAKQVCREGKIPFEITLGENYKEKLCMNQSITYDVIMYSMEDAFESIKSHFGTLNEGLEFIKSKSEKLFIEHFTRICFSINILNFDSHSHMLQFDDKGLFYIRDGIITPIEYDENQIEKNDEYLLNLVEGYIKALIH